MPASQMARIWNLSWLTLMMDNTKEFNSVWVKTFPGKWSGDARFTGSDQLKEPAGLFAWMTLVRILKALASKIEDECEKEMFCCFSMRSLAPDNYKKEGNLLVSEFDTIHNKDWTKLEHWSKWWFRVNHLTMFTRAFKEMDDKDWEQGPSTTNPIESLNRQSLQEGDNILHALMENIYLEIASALWRQQLAKRTWQRPTNHHLASRRLNESDDALSMKEWNVMGTETNTLHILNIDLAIEKKHKRNKLNIL